MGKSAVNHWAGKAAEDVLAETLHQLRVPIYTATGSLSMLKSVLELSAEQTQQMVHLALSSVLHARDVIDFISLYLAEGAINQ